VEEAKILTESKEVIDLISRFRRAEKALVWWQALAVLLALAAWVALSRW
jgi:uncharacterized membrane protein YdcZ (DUF606 family)